MNKEIYLSSPFSGKIKEMVKMAESFRNDKDNPVDVTLETMVKEKFNCDLAHFYNGLGIDPHVDSLENLVTMFSEEDRWIVPEIFREALRLGYRKSPIWPSIIAAEESVKGLTQILPHINMSDAAPRLIGEAETIPLGTLSVGKRNFSGFKVGRGIALSYEVLQYCSINVLSIFLQDFGLKLGFATDVLALETLINGEQLDGSNSAPVIGVASTVNGLQYIDLLRVWIRMSRIGRVPGTMLGGETAALNTLLLPEFRTPVVGTPMAKLDLKTPIPNSASYFVHGNVPDKQTIIMDPKSALLKMNIQPIKLESEKIVSNQTEAFYVTLSMGFAKLFRESALIIDADLAFAQNGFPTWLDVDAAQNVNIE